MTATGSLGVRPREVGGFEAAVASGVVRPVPPTPPPLLDGPSAARLFSRFLAKSAAVVAGVLIALAVFPRLGLGTTAISLLSLAAGLIGLWAIMRFLGNVGDRKLEELRHGYTTLELDFGGFWLGEGRRWPRFGRRIPWDYSGVWLLDGTTGAARQAPDRDRDPPGLYPSPNRPGVLELYSGVVWTGDYRPLG